MPLLEEGLYYGRLVEIGTDCLDTEGKTPFVYVAWQVTHRAIDGDWAPIEAIRRESRWWVTEKAEPYTMDRLETLGFNGDFDAPSFRAEPHPEHQGVELLCRHNVREGTAYENWDLASARREKNREPWDADSQRRFKAKYHTRLAAREQPQGKPGAPPAPPPQEQPRRTAGDASPIRDEELPSDPKEGMDVSDDEIPF